MSSSYIPGAASIEIPLRDTDEVSTVTHTCINCISNCSFVGTAVYYMYLICTPIRCVRAGDLTCYDVKFPAMVSLILHAKVETILVKFLVYSLASKEGLKLLAWSINLLSSPAVKPYLCLRH